MKKLIYILLLLPLTVAAQTSDDEGRYFGAGLVNSHYTTYWYYYRYDGRPGRYNYPVHKLNRTFLSVYGEKKGLFHWSPFRADVGAEVLLGVAGKTIGEWLPETETISSGGFSLGLGATFKIAYPLTTASGLSIAPFFGLGPQLMVSYCNGKGLGKEYASISYYGYEDGWVEYLLMMTGTLGCTFEVKGLDISPSLRFGVIGSSLTSWEPNEDGVDMDSSPTMWGLSITVGKKF